MVRRLLLLLALTALAPLAAAESATAPAAPAALAAPAAAVEAFAPATPVPPASEAEAWAAKFNPDIFALNADGTPAIPMRNAFTSGASDIAHDVSVNNWFNLLVFLPFLVAPQILLLVVIFKFRDRGDGRKPATFMTNHKLEAIWTIIPCLALVVVSVPVWHVLYKMELPPDAVDTNDARQATLVKIIGKKFSWEYEYKHEGLAGINLDAGRRQEPLVLAKDRTAVISMTSNDVNHAWWIPAFGVKKDCIRGRYTNAWFTPDSLGVYKGNCTELCGEGHGIMWISAIVVTPEEFDVWTTVQRHRADAFRVWMLLQPVGGGGTDEGRVREAVARYFEKDRSPARRFALRYWVSANYLTLRRDETFQRISQDLEANESRRKALIDELIAAAPAAGEPVAAR